MHLAGGGIFLKQITDRNIEGRNSPSNYTDDQIRIWTTSRNTQLHLPRLCLQDLVKKGHREREKQRYNSKGEGLWLATTLSKSYRSLGSKWLSMRRLGHWYQEWGKDSHDIIDQTLIQVLGQWERICYNSRHINIIIPYLQTPWLYIFKFLSQDISLTYLPDYQWPLLKFQDFLI